MNTSRYFLLIALTSLSAAACGTDQQGLDPDAVAGSDAATNTEPGEADASPGDRPRNDAATTATDGKSADAATADVRANDRPPPVQGILFSSGWENRTELGCNLDALVDRDYDGSPAVSATGFGDTPPFPRLCTGANGQPNAEIVVDTGHDGAQSRMLRVRQSTGNVNGTDFRVGQVIRPTQTDFYASWWVKYSANWQWSSHDHKVFITGAEDSQDVYFNVRGHNDGSPGYVVIHVLPSDTRFDSTAQQMSVGVWHFCELHVVSGAHGKVEARVDGVPVPFPAQNEYGHRIVDLNTGRNTFYGKLDTTYNDGAFIDAHMSLDAPWFIYYDDIQMGTGTAF